MKRSALFDIVSKNTKTEGINPSFMDSIFLCRVDDSYDEVQAVLEPSICIMLNGRKVLKIGNQPMTLNPNTIILASSKLVVESEYRGITKEDPGYGIIVKVDQKILRDLLFDYEKFNNDNLIQKEKNTLIDTLEINGELFEKLFRLIQSSTEPESAHIMGKQLLREFYYALLKSPIKHMLYKFGNLSSKGQEVSKVIHFFEENLNEKISMDDIAKLSGLSSSVLHNKFKAMTNLSPMQFLKDLRLHNAKALILNGSRVSESAYNSGYNNMSQFSREFKRKFGVSPKDITVDNPAY